MMKLRLIAALINAHRPRTCRKISFPFLKIFKSRRLEILINLPIFKKLPNREG